MLQSGLSEPTGGRPLPAWARVADFLAVLLAIVAVAIELSGGFRTRVGSWRVTLTSPSRLLLEAAAITIVRHLITRDVPAYRHLASRIAAWLRSTPLRTATIVVVATRPAIFLVGYLAVVMIGSAPGATTFHDFNIELLNLPLRWDAGWYLGIASRGYEFEAGGAELQRNIVFFPAYPAIVRIVALVLGKSLAAYVIGATLVSLALFAAALAYLYQLAREELTEEQATAALWLLAAYPFSLFYGAIYTESLFLLGSVAAFHHMRKDEPLRAAMCGLVVGLTRPNGIVLSVPLGLLAIERARDWPLYSALRVKAPLWAAAASPVGGALLYSAFVWRLTGDPLAWLSGHAAWGRHYDGLTQLVVSPYGYIVGAGLLQYVSLKPYDLLNGLSVLFILGTIWPVYRRFGLPYAAFILLNILPPLAAGGLMSAGRFSSVLFPAFLYLGARVPARHRAGWIGTFAAMQAFNATLFYTWRPLY